MSTALVFDAVGSPKITRICEKTERGSIRFFETGERPAAVLELFRQQGFFAFEIADAGLISRDHRGAVRLDDPVEELADFAFDQHHVTTHGGGVGLGVLQAAFPQVAEHGEGEGEQGGAGFQFGQERFEIAFDPFLAD